MAGLPSGFAFVLSALAVAGIGLVALSALVLERWDGTGARALAAFAGTPGIGALSLVAAGVGWNVRPAATGGDGAALWGVAVVLVLLVTTVPWLGFAMWYTGQGKRLGVNRWWFALALLPLLVLAGVLVAPVVTPGEGIELGQGWVLQSILGIALLVGVVYWNVLHFTGVVAVLRTVYVYGNLRSVQGSLVTLAGITPLLLYWIGFGVQLPGDPSFLVVQGGAVGTGLLVTAACLWTALVRYDLLGRTPAPGNLGRAALLEEIDDLVFVTDEEERVVEANRTATDELGVRKSELLGTPVSEVIGTGVSEAAAVDCVRLNTVEGSREFDAEVSTLTDQRGTPMGNVVTMHDVTDRTIREQRIEVLNRVLRHNLRNKMSIVKGTADYVADGELPPEGLAEGLGTVADEMVELGEKAREIERVIQEGEHVPTAVDVERTVGVIADDVRDRYPGVTVRVSVPEDTTVRTDKTLLSYAIENLVENAAEHNDVADPRVAIEVETGEEYPLRVTVADNGPGIPDHERAVIDEGEETPLEHGSGLGLWATNWCVARLGGELTFEDPGGGSRVSVEVPDTPAVDHGVEGIGDRASVHDD